MTQLPERCIECRDRLRCPISNWVVRTSGKKSCTD